MSFLNSEGAERNEPPEWIASYEDLVWWSEYVGALESEAAGRLERRAKDRPAEARETMARAIDFREALYRVLSAAIRGERPAPDDERRLTAEIAAAHAHLRLRPDEQGWDWSLDDRDELDSVLWPVALDAADLLTAGDFARVKECAGPTCAWMFLDQSRNRSRRWCDMAQCGNRSKARRYYERTRDREAPAR